MLDFSKRARRPSQIRSDSLNWHLIWETRLTGDSKSALQKPVGAEEAPERKQRREFHLKRLAADASACSQRCCRAEWLNDCARWEGFGLENQQTNAAPHAPFSLRFPSQTQRMSAFHLRTETTDGIHIHPSFRLRSVHVSLWRR